jgi:hypothetical protein
VAGHSLLPETLHAQILTKIMGKQYNKMEKRRRRERYVKRKTAAARKKKPAAKPA